MRSALGSGRPLKRPPLTTQNTVVLRPMPTPSVRMAPRESVGYRISIRTPDVRSPRSRSIDSQDGTLTAVVRARLRQAFRDAGARELAQGVRSDPPRRRVVGAGQAARDGNCRSIQRAIAFADG